MMFARHQHESPWVWLASVSSAEQTVMMLTIFALERDRWRDGAAMSLLHRRS